MDSSPGRRRFEPRSAMVHWMDPAGSPGDKRPGAVNFIVGVKPRAARVRGLQATTALEFPAVLGGLNADGNGPEPTEARYGTIRRLP